jgi:hypothetical protein
MVGIKFKAQSGNIFEWIVISEHSMFSDTWECYALNKYVPGEALREPFMQHFSTDFINKNKF